MEFRSWGKTPRLFRDVVITEKIDGTNSAVIIEQVEDTSDREGVIAFQKVDDVLFAVGAQSKNRLIVPGKQTDNYNFAQWVEENAEILVRELGVGHHFGEWWGKGILRRHGHVGYRVFSLFNTRIHRDTFFRTPALNGMDVIVESVPVLYEGEFSEEAVQQAAKDLLKYGSLASYGDEPEGICIYHTQSKQVYKYTFDGQDRGKWELSESA